MSTSKHINQICVAVTAVMLILAILLMTTGNLGISYADTTVMGYENRLFRTDVVHTIDIVINDWEDFLETCENEEYSACTVLIDGEKQSNVGIRAKGNTSLSSVKSMDSQRYSFKLEFDHYESGKSYYGLDKLCLNNLIQDNTMMKDYLVYQMMREFGVDAPLCSYVYITVNGEDWGLYLAVEGIEDSFLRRNYGSDAGDLYKPDTMSNGGGRGNGKDFSMSDFDFDDIDEEDLESFMDAMPQMPSGDAQSGMSQMPSGDAQSGMSQMPSGDAQSGMPQMSSGDAQSGMSQMPSGDTQSGMPQMPSGDTQSGMPQMPSDDAQSGEVPAQSDSQDAEQSDSNQFGGMDFSNMGGGMGFSMGSSDVKLQYSDDNPESYSNIFDNAKTDVTEEDQARLIASLKNLNEYTDLENTLDIDEVLRYFVVHNFVYNNDSYTGTMVHNYYLHEKDGQLSMIPWDYNLAYGTMMGGNASSIINASIDSPVLSGSVDDRPMVGWIFSDETYTEMYHELFAEFIEEWFDSGKLTQMIADANELIRPYVEKDPTKFCTLEEYDAGVSEITEFVTLRAEAVTRQLNGDATAVDTSGLNISAMGTMNNTIGGGKDMDFGFDVSSLITITDKDGNAVDVESLIGDVDSLASIAFSDGTSVSIGDADMRNLMQMDFADIVSVTDADGNVIDLSEYTISMQSFDFSAMKGGRTKDAANSAESATNMPSMDNATNMPNMPSMDNATNMPNMPSMDNATNMPNMPSMDSATNAPDMPSAENMTDAKEDAADAEQETTRSSSDSSRPSMRMSGGDSQGEDNTLLLCVISAVVLAVGLFIAIKKKY